MKYSLGLDCQITALRTRLQYILDSLICNFNVRECTHFVIIDSQNFLYSRIILIYHLWSEPKTRQPIDREEKFVPLPQNSEKGSQHVTTQQQKMTRQHVGL